MTLGALASEKNILCVFGRPCGMIPRSMLEEGQDRRRSKSFVVCPECGGDMDPHSLLCRKCFTKAGGPLAPIYRAAHERGESSLKRPKPPGIPKRAYHKWPTLKTRKPWLHTRPELHLRWHVRRGIIKPDCRFCQADQFLLQNLPEKE